MNTQAATDPKLKRLGIETQTHDFLTPQPASMKSAKIYYLRTVLHDWPNEICGKILTQLRGAMAADSVIIVDEVVVPDVGANAKTVNYDMDMMTVLSGKERTEAQWESILVENGW